MERRRVRKLDHPSPLADPTTARHDGLLVRWPTEREFEVPWILEGGLAEAPAKRKKTKSSLTLDHRRA